MLEKQIGSELQPQPLFELDDQIYRICGIEAQPAEFDIRPDLLLRQIERARQISDAPVTDRGFAGTFRPQEIPRVATRETTRIKVPFPNSGTLGGSRVARH